MANNVNQGIKVIIKMAATWTFIHILIAISFCYCKASSYPVPLLIWSTKSVDVDDEILAGHTLNYEDVQVKYLDKLKAQSNTICLFVQDKLSIDDFAANPGMDLKHLKDVLHSSPTSIVLPSVSLEQDFEAGERKNKLVEYLEKNSHGVVIPLTPQDVTDFPDRIKSLRTDVPIVIIVHLPKAKNGEDSMRNLEPSDEIIGKVSDVLSSHFPDYVALLTADMPRDDVRSGMAAARQLSVSHARERRSTADNVTKLPCNQTGVLVAKHGAMIYITDIYLHGRGNTSDAFINTTNEILPESDIKVDNTSGLMLSFPLKDVFKNGSDIYMSITFNRSGIRWWCESIEITGKIEKETIEASYDCKDKIDVPIDKSYACQIFLNFTDGKEKNKSVLAFYGIQLQPYEVKNNMFANAYDCVGFFTPAIWMGLISVGVLVAILYGGMLALLSIKSMDRFDNPKDPPLVINSE